MAISNSLRFQVLRRDKHCCYYCGARAPEAVLTVDHVVPSAHGGADDPSNLVAACSECNSGKAATPLDAEYVSRVKEEYLDWRAALDYASELAAAARDGQQSHRDHFIAKWKTWHYTDSGATVPIGENWPDVVDQLISGGLADGDLAECVDKAMRARCKGSTFAYFIGIARNMLAARHEVAAMYMREQERRLSGSET